MVFLLTTAPAPPDSRHWTQSFVIVTTMPAGRAWRGPAVLYSTVHCTQSAVPCAGSVSLGMLIVMEEGPSLPAGGGDSRHSAPAPPPGLLATLLALLLLSSLPPPAASHPHCSHHYPRDHQVGRTSQPGSIRLANGALVISDKASGMARGLQIAALLTLHIRLDSAIRTSHLHY